MQDSVYTNTSKLFEIVIKFGVFIHDKFLELVYNTIFVLYISCDYHLICTLFGMYFISDIKPYKRIDCVSNTFPTFY